MLEALLSGSVKAGYGRNYDDWLEANPGVPFTPYFLNPLLAAAWAEFEANCKAIIIRAAERCGIYPLNANAANFQGSVVSTSYDLVAIDKAAASPPPTELELERTETTSKVTVIQMKAAAPDSTIIIRSAAASFFETSFIKPAAELQRELAEQRELKKQTASLEIDRAIPTTEVGRWVGRELVARLKGTGDAKKAKALEDKAKKAERNSARAVAHVELLKAGDEALAALRADRQVESLPTTPLLVLTSLLCSYLHSSRPLAVSG